METISLLPYCIKQFLRTGDRLLRNYIRIKTVDFGFLLQWPSLFNGHRNLNSS
jgi:hypothetical protein